jgi:plastocyanin
MSNKSTSRFVLVVMALLMMLGAACGSDEADGDGGDAAQNAGQDAPEEEPSPEDTGPPTIVASDFAYEAPETLPAGETTFKFQNVGKQKHIAVFVELLEGKTLEDVNTFIAEEGVGGKPPSWVRQVRKAQGFAKPGETTEFKAEFTPGNYAMLCFIRDKDSGKLHAQLGMTGAITFE